MFKNTLVDNCVNGRKTAVCKMKENYISKEGLKKLQEELEELKNIKRPLTVEKITRARDQGDLSENAEYHEAREEQSFIEGKIQELEYLIKNSIVIKSDTIFI